MLNQAMICSILRYKRPDLLSLAEHSIYSAVLALNYESLTQNVHSQFENFTRDIVLSDSNTTEALPAIQSLLHRNVSDAELCEQIISHLSFCVENLSDFCAELEILQDAVWDLLLEHDRVIPTWENVNAYLLSYELNQAIKTFVEKNCEVLASSTANALDDEIKAELVMSDIGVDAFKVILPCLWADDLVIQLDQVTPEKLEIMIDNHFLTFTPETYSELNKAHPTLCADFILQNQSACCKYLKEIPLTALGLEALVLSGRMEKSVLEAMLKQNDPELLTEKTAIRLCTANTKVNRRWFAAIWDMVDHEDACLHLMFQNLAVLTRDDFDKYLAELNEPYCMLIRCSGRHEEILPNSPENQALAERLRAVDYLTSYELQTQVSRNSKNEQIELSTIRCRIKAKSTKTATAAAK